MDDWEARASTSPFDADEYHRRWRAVQAEVRRRDLAAAVFQQSRNVLYFGGIAAHGQIVVPADGDPTFLVQIDADRAARVSALDVVASRGVRQLVALLRSHGAERAVVGIEKDAVPVSNMERLARELPDTAFVDISEAAYRCRMIKSAAEIEVLGKAAGISSQLFSLLGELARPGATEIELHTALAAAARMLGSDGLMAKRAWNERTLENGWLASGPNTAQISGYWLTMTGSGPSPARPYGPTGRQLEEGDLLVFDTAANFYGYHTDQARTYVVGRADELQRRYATVLEQMQRAAIAATRPGEAVGAPYEAAQAVARSHGVDGYFMTHATVDFAYVGHGVGLEADEPPLLSPRSADVFEVGMTVAIEPKIIVPAWGGLTLEDTVVVTESGAQTLTYADDRFELPAA